MELTLSSKYKSLNSFSYELPDFAILTGLNGAGKTQILNGILSGDIKLTENSSQIGVAQIKYIPVQGLAPNDSIRISDSVFGMDISESWDKYSSFREQPRSGDFEGLVGKNTPDIKLFRKIAGNAKKDILILTEEDFYSHYPIEGKLDNNNIFYHDFSNIFKRYYDKKEENDIKQFQNSKGRTSVSYLTDDEFLKKYGESPWDLLNEILLESKLDFHVNSPENLPKMAPFELKLVNNSTKDEIKFSELSSGEKVLISLGLSLYNAKIDMEFPKVLLMDEPDSSLHPSMIKQFLDTVKNVLVKEKGVKVIMTTHSPSTIALAPEETIFIVNKEGDRIEKASKDKALRILTSGVPSFSVNYENRRQVFVESHNDAKFYEKIYQRISYLLLPEISLSFISSGESKIDRNGTRIATCDQVKNITQILRKAGNGFVWGIVDWDKKNKSEDNIIVLGEGNRYSIENYLFDPLLIGALLLREKFITRQDISLTEDQTYADFKKISPEQLQVISDFIVEKVSAKVKSDDNTKTVVKLLNGTTITIPIWYLHCQGHELEKLLLEVFPELNGLKRRKEEALKLEILNKVVDDIPEIISIDFLETLKKLQAV